MGSRWAGQKLDGPLNLFQIEEQAVGVNGKPHEIIKGSHNQYHGVLAAQRNVK